MTQRKSFSYATLFVAAGLTLAACGSTSDGDRPAAGTNQAARAPATEATRAPEGNAPEAGEATTTKPPPTQTTTTTQPPRPTTSTTMSSPSTSTSTSATTSAPPATTTTRATSTAVSYDAILGRDFDDPAVLDYVGRYGCEADGLHYLCRQAGTQLNFNSGRRLVSMLLYAPGVEGVYGYVGPMPGGLSWNDDQPTVEEKIGPAQSSYPGYPPTMAWSKYANPSILVTWNTTGTPGPGTTMHHLQVNAA